MAHTLLIIYNIFWFYVLFLPPGGVFCVSHMSAVSITAIAQSKTLFFKILVLEMKNEMRNS